MRTFRHLLIWARIQIYLYMRMDICIGGCQHLKDKCVDRIIYVYLPMGSFTVARLATPCHATVLGYWHWPLHGCSGRHFGTSIVEAPSELKRV